MRSLPQYHVAATNSDGSERATAFFYILAPGISWASTNIDAQDTIAAYGSAGTISGQDFPANEQVTLYWNYQQAGQVEVGTVIAAADGSFTFDLTTPSSPFAGNATIEAIASTSTFMASFQVQPQAAVFLNPTSALVGNAVSISGGSFDGNATVTIELAVSTLVGTVTAASDGTFTTSFTIPANTQGGPSIVSVSDGTVSASTTLVIQVPLTITPTTGSAGTSITVQSLNFSGNGNDARCFTYRPSIDWYDPTTGTSLYLSTACSQGPLNKIVKAPSTTVSGRTYVIELISGGYVIGQATFTAQ